LYPSQSWASVGMGVPWKDHGVFWYGDEKPKRYPFYWQAAAAAGQSVGLVGVLHSSPMQQQCGDPQFRFVLPDSFAGDEAARPADLEAIQAFNLRLSRQSARVASVRPGIADLGGAVSLARHGVRLSTWSALGTLAAQVARRKWNRERLRVGQSLLLADVFENQIRRHDPDLSVLFINHLASAMHRYWASTFPEDWNGSAPYGDDWQRTNEGEIPFAMKAVDRIVARLVDLADATDRKLVIVSSMGQKADLTVQSDRAFQAVVRQPLVFLAACGLRSGVEVRGAMVPQVTMAFPSQSDAVAAQTRLVDTLGSSLQESMIAGEALTITYEFECRLDAVRFGETWVEPSSIGVSIESIQDHRSGRHSPRGLLISGSREQWPTETDALRVAPLLLEQLGVASLSHHLTTGGESDTTDRAVDHAVTIA